MRLGKWVLAVAVLALCFGMPAEAQYQPNELNIHAGARFWSGGPGAGGWGYPNHGLSHYFPSFSHWAGSIDLASMQFLWKIDGWSWTSMQGSTTSSVWYFDSALQYSIDSPYATDTKINGSKGMGWDYPKMLCLGSVTGALPDFIWGGRLPGVVPLIGGNHRGQFPSSLGGLDSYWNFFAVATGSVVTSLPNPFNIWVFGLAGDCTAPITAPSNSSIFEYVWVNRPQTVVPQYMLVAGDEFDCTGTAAGNVGNKARNFTVTCDSDNGWYWGWGSTYEAGHSLAVCDIVTIPVNVPGNTVSGINPYIGLGFDVGGASVTPFVSSGCVTLQFMSLANQAPGAVRATLASLNYWPGAAPWSMTFAFGPGGLKRIAHSWDVITGLMFKLVTVFAHTPLAGYPGYMFASHAGANSIGVPFPPDPFAFCLELRFSTLQFAIGPGTPYTPQPAGPSSASFMTTNF